MADTILCKDRNDAKKCVDSIGSKYIDDLEYLETGEVRIILNTPVKEISEAL